MFGMYKRLLNLITVEEKEGGRTGRIIEIDGIPTKHLVKIISNQWRTTRVTNNMILKERSYSMIIPAFYALELEYVLMTLLDGNKAKGVPLHIRRAISSILQRLREDTWLSKRDAVNPEWFDWSELKHFQWKPLAHQMGFLKRYEKMVKRYNLNGYVLGSAAGTGKTAMGLYISLLTKADTTIIVSPKNALNRVWVDTLESAYKKPMQMWVSDRNEPITKKHNMFVCHYDSLDKLLDGLQGMSLGNLCVILDESHNFNNKESLRTTLFVKLCKDHNASNVLWSSGTPIKAMGTECIPFLSTIDPLFTSKVELIFKDTYGKQAKKALDIISHRIGEVTYRVDKSVVVEGEPNFTDLKVKIPKSNLYTLESIRVDMREFIERQTKLYQSQMPTHVSDYERIISNFKREHVVTGTKEQQERFSQYVHKFALIRKAVDLKPYLDDMKWCNVYEDKVIRPTLSKEDKVIFKNVKSIVKYVRLKVMGECLGRILGRKRVECHLAMIPYLNLKGIVETSEKKTVIFTSYVEVAKAIVVYMKEQGFKPVAVFGETNKNLSGIVADFDKNPNTNPLVATYQSLSTAVPLIMANTAVLTNYPFRPHELEQTIARIHRLGQDTQTEVINCTLDTGEDTNISTRNLDIMAWCQSQVDLIMGTADEAALAVENDLMEDIVMEVENPELGVATEAMDMDTTYPTHIWK